MTSNQSEPTNQPPPTQSQRSFHQLHHHHHHSVPLCSCAKKIISEMSHEEIDEFARNVVLHQFFFCQKTSKGSHWEQRQY